jgi:hypothetical protein
MLTPEPSRRRDTAARAETLVSVLARVALGAVVIRRDLADALARLSDRLAKDFRADAP